MEVQVLSSAPRLALLVLAASACTRESERDSRNPLVRGTLTSEPALLLAPPSDRPNGVVHGRLNVRLEHELPAGSSLRIVQGYDEPDIHGRWLGGSELRYALSPVPDLAGRAFGVGARLVDRATRAQHGFVPVVPLPPELGWLEVRLDRPLPAGDDLEIQLGDPANPGLGPPTNTLPVEVQLAVDVRTPEAREAPVRLDGRVWVRIAPDGKEADWLRVTATGGSSARATVAFMAGFSGPMRSSVETTIPAGELEVRGPFDPFTVPVAAEPPSDRPKAVSIELPALPEGTHRIGLRFMAEASEGPEAKRELQGLSNPLVVGGGAMPTFFGSIHGHTLVGGHATSTPSRALRYAREVSALDFVALSEHRESAEFDGAQLARLAREESESGSFVVFTAYEWTDAQSGHRHVLARTPSEPPPAPPDLAEFAASVGRDPDVIVVGHHSLWHGGTAQKTFDWGEPGLLPRQLLAEAYSWHGCSLAHDSDFPMHGNHEQELPRELGTDVLSALARGHRMFLVADGDNHLGKPGSLIGIEWPKGRRYAYQGLVAVRAPKLERDALFRAMESGNVYGTTGARMLVDATRKEKSAEVRVHATAPLARITLRSPTEELAEKEFEAVPRTLGPADAPLFLDGMVGVWSTTVDLALRPPAATANADAPWIVEVAQQDGHHAWLLLPPASWTK